MADWLGYTLRDVLMFGPEVYWRLFALHNRALWPLPAVAIALGVGILVLLALSKRRWHAAAGLAVALGWVGAAHFLATQYAPINWPMGYAVWAFGAQAVLIGALAVAGRLTAAGPASGPARWLGLGLLGYSVLLHPVVGLALDRPPAQAEIAGLAPDPTALATLGLLLLVARPMWAAPLALVPLTWCIVSAVTLLALGAPQGWILVIAPGLWALGHFSRIRTDRHRS